MSEPAVSAATRTLYESGSTVVRRAERNGEHAIVKCLQPGARSGLAIARLHHEYQINQSLTSARICRAVAFNEFEHEIVFEDRQCRALREVIGSGRLTFDERIEVAIGIAEALQSVHDEGVIHRDVNPGNIVVAEPELDVYLIDFGFATVAPREYPLQDTADSLTGTLPYLSPEQTGRVNRVVDYRTDLYSLGATLYELFAGAPPFTHADPLELLHAHIASQPKPLCAVDPAIPRWLSDLVQKLLAKQPEDRYQSAAAVRDDLDGGQHHANVIPFRLGSTDAPKQLVLPKRLYGRESHLDLVIGALDRAAQGEALVTEIVGTGGMGKTVMCEALARYARECGFLVGRIDALGERQQDGPILWLALLRHAIRQALASAAPEHVHLIERLEELGAEHHQTLRQFVPELARRLPAGDDPPAPYSQTVTQLLRALQPLPLCVILEDADHLSEEQVEYLLDTGIGARHVLMVMSQSFADPLIARHPRYATKRTLVELVPLDKGDIRKLLADLLSLGEMRVRELAAQLFEKSAGVPGHLLELIFELHHGGAIRYQSDQREWTWDLEAVRAHYFSNNSAERIRGQLAALPPATQGAMNAGAAIGDQFSGGVIGRMFGWSNAETAAALRPAATQGLLRLLSGEVGDADEPLYQFAHHRIRAQIYGQLPAQEKFHIHQGLAETLKALGNRDGGTVLLIADHLNAAIELVGASEDQRVDCAFHNLLAGREALRQSAYQLAYKYSRSGLALGLERNGEHAPMLEALAQNAAEAAYLCGDFEQLHRVIGEAPSGNSGINEVRVRAALVQNQLVDAEAIAHEALVALGERTVGESAAEARAVQRLPGAAALTNARERLWRRLHRTLPTPLRLLDDVRRHQVLRLQGYLLHTGYHTANPGLPDLARRMIRAGARDGYCAEISFAYAALAAGAIADGDPTAAKELADRARLLADRFPDEAFTIRTRTLLAGLVEPWLQPVDPLLTGLARQHRASWAHKDFEFTAAATVCYAWNGLLRGVELGALRQTLHAQIAQLCGYPHVTDVNVARFALQIVDSLTGRTEPDAELGQELPIRNPDDVVALGSVYILRLYFAVLFQDFRGAAEILPLARRYGVRMAGSPMLALLSFCEGLVALRQPDDNDASARRRWPLGALRGAASGSGLSRARRRLLERNRARLERWRGWGGQLVDAKALILEAELAWHDGHETRALEKFEQAAEAARRAGLAHDEGIAYELAARHCSRAGRTDFARLFAQCAHRCYLRWGAAAKTAQIERDFHVLLQDRLEHFRLDPMRPDNLAHVRLDEITSVTPTLEGGEFSERMLETSTVLRAAQTLSGEIQLDLVLAKLLRLALEHAAGQKACMLLFRDQRLFVEAVATVDGEPARRLSPRSLWAPTPECRRASCSSWPRRGKRW